MARKKKQTQGGTATGGWLVTFSDLITLLLTFFVLLLSMSSMDSAKISRISIYPDHFSSEDMEAAGRIPERIIEFVEMIKDPDNILEKQDRLKDLLFPHDVLPPEMLVDVTANIRILEHPEGVVIVLTGGLLFPPNEALLDDEGKKLLELLYPVILAVNADVNISGFTDSRPGEQYSNDDLSAFRALSVLEYFLQKKIKANRFSVSGYGQDKPLYPNTTPENRAKNRRVEILLKTTSWLGKYS